MRTHKALSFKTVVPTVLIALFACMTVAAAGQDVFLKIPFDFQAGKTHFAPGAYVLSVDKTSSGALVIRSADHSRSAIVLARKSITPGFGTAPTVSFRTYGDTRFLSTIQSEGSGRWDMVPTGSELAIARLNNNEEGKVASLQAANAPK